MIGPMVATLAAFALLGIFTALAAPRRHRYGRHTIHHYKTKQASR